jgi:hypothetical protein
MQQQKNPRRGQWTKLVVVFYDTKEMQATISLGQFFIVYNPSQKNINDNEPLICCCLQPIFF